MTGSLTDYRKKLQEATQKIETEQNTAETIKEVVEEEKVHKICFSDNLKRYILWYSALASISLPTCTKSGSRRPQIKALPVWRPILLKNTVQCPWRSLDSGRRTSWRSGLGLQLSCRDGRRVALASRITKNSYLPMFMQTEAVIRSWTMKMRKMSNSHSSLAQATRLLWLSIGSKASAVSKTQN